MTDWNHELEINEGKTQRIKETMEKLHKLSHKVIYGRPDVSEPLNFTQAENFKKLEEAYMALEDKMHKLKREKMRIEKELEIVRQLKNIKLTDQELKLLTHLREFAPSCISVSRLTTVLDMTRARVYEHVRSFVMAGYVQPKSPRKIDGYFMTVLGKQFFDAYEKTQAEA